MKQKLKKIVIFGISDLATQVSFYFQNDSNYEIVAYTVDAKFNKEGRFLGLPVIDFEEIEEKYPPESYGMFIAIGYTQLNKLRAVKYEEAKLKGYELVSYISTSSTFWENTIIGENCFIFDNCILQPFLKIGNNVIVWSGAFLGHNSFIDDHCFIAAKVVISGYVNIKSFCFIGVNSTIRDHITIEKECILGAGSLIMKNTLEKEVYIPDRTKRSVFHSEDIKKWL